MNDPNRSFTDFDEEPIRQDPRHWKASKVPRIAIAAGKGGVGKTTNIINIAYRIVQPPYKCRTLIFDFDGQGNLSKYFTHNLYMNNLNEYLELETKEERKELRNNLLERVNVPYDSSVMRLLEGQAASVLENYGIGCVGWVQDWEDNFTDEIGETFMAGINATIEQYMPDIVFFDTPPVNSPQGQFCLQNATHFFSCFNGSYDAYKGAAEGFRVSSFLEENGYCDLVKCCGIIPNGMREREYMTRSLLISAKDDYSHLLTTPIPDSGVFGECNMLSAPLGDLCKTRIKELEEQGTSTAMKGIARYQKLIDIMDHVVSEIVSRIENDKICEQLTREVIAEIRENFVSKTLEVE